MIAGTLSNGQWATWLSVDGGTAWTHVTVPAPAGAQNTVTGWAPTVPA